MATDRKRKTHKKAMANLTNIDIQAMFLWLTLLFYDFCSFRSVAVNSVYKLQFLHLFMNINMSDAEMELFAVVLSLLSS